MWVWNRMLFQHFDWNLTYQVLFLHSFPSHQLNVRDQPWRWPCFGAEWTFVVAAFLKSISDVRQSIPSFISLSTTVFVFSRTASKSTANSWFLSEGHVFKSNPRCFGPLGKFQDNTEISIKTIRVSRPSFRVSFNDNFLSPIFSPYLKSFKHVTSRVSAASSE